MHGTTITIRRPGVVFVAILAFVFCGCRRRATGSYWRTFAVRADGTVAGWPVGSIVVARPQQNRDDVHVRMADRLWRQRDCRVIAVQKCGSVLTGNRRVQVFRKRNCRATITVFTGVRLRQIDEFRFQWRAIEPPGASGVREDARTVGASRRGGVIDAAGDGDVFAANYFN